MNKDVLRATRLCGNGKSYKNVYNEYESKSPEYTCT